MHKARVKARMFSDIATHWASGCIVALAQRELIAGYSNGAFRPNAKVSRAEFAAVMLKIFPQLPAQQSAVTFSDVFAEYWASDAIRWISERNLLSGYPQGTFRPRQTLSRVQAVMALMIGLEGLQEGDIQLSQTSDLAAETFCDAAQIPAYARGAISVALSRQILTPLSELIREPRLLRPNQAITRGEVTALVCRTLGIPAETVMRDDWTLVADQDWQVVFQQFLQQEAGFNAEKLAFLDLGIARSPYRKAVAQAASRLQTPEAVPVGLSQTIAYPPRGKLAVVNEGTLAFLSPDILSGCVCVSTLQAGQLVTRWLGREAFVARQMWSATKFIPLLNVLTRVDAFAPTANHNHLWVRRAGSAGRGYAFNDLAAGIMSYDDRISTSNALAAMFKQFEEPERLEKWTQQMTGNSQLSFQGRYGELPFIQQPELWNCRTKQVLLKAVKTKHSGSNLVSTYDLTRLLSMLGWHWQLPAVARIPNLQSHSVESLIRAMGVDIARYVDVAFKALGLSKWVRSPVIISKSGFGRSDERDRTELTYCGLVHFSLPRQGVGQRAPDPTATHQSYSLCFTLIAAQNVGDADREARYVDALMATSVTELIRRTVTETL